MTVKQISVFVENKTGGLATITDILAKAGVNIRALSIAETSDFGILRLIVDDVFEAGNALREQGKIYSITDVLAVAGEDRSVQLTLDGVALLADINMVSADSFQEVQVGGKVGNFFFDGTSQNERRVPAAGDAHAAQVQSLLQLDGILRIVVANLAAGKAGQCHFADNLLESVFGTQFRHVIIAPTDRGNTQRDALGIKHKNILLDN